MPCSCWRRRGCAFRTRSERLIPARPCVTFTRPPGWRNRYTQQTQNLPSARNCRFESDSGHDEAPQGSPCGASCVRALRASNVRDFASSKRAVTCHSDEERVRNLSRPSGESPLVSNLGRPRPAQREGKLRQLAWAVPCLPSPRGFWGRVGESCERGWGRRGLRPALHASPATNALFTARASPSSVIRRHHPPAGPVPSPGSAMAATSTLSMRLPSMSTTSTR